MLTIGLEESLPKLPAAVVPSKLWSPYRLPLIRFLNQYPSERQARRAGLGSVASRGIAMCFWAPHSACICRTDSQPWPAGQLLWPPA